jgi:glucokinase
MQAIGIDIGGTTTKAGLVDETGEILNLLLQPTVTDSAEALLDTLASMIEELRHLGHLDGVGLGIPGLRSKFTGVIEFSPNLPYLNGVNLETRLSERIALPVVGRNDADMSAWGEFTRGAGVGTTDLACLTLGTGVGSGLILDGHPYSGHHGYAAEAGHMIVDPEGLPCPCGGRGCLETVASATGVVALAQRRLDTHTSSALHDAGNPLTAEAIHNAALKGDPLAIDIFFETGRYLGLACANLINLLNLDMIVIGGGLSAAGELLLKSARIEAQERAYTQSFSGYSISVAKLGNNAGIIGAALLSMSRA